MNIPNESLALRKLKIIEIAPQLGECAKSGVFYK